VFPIGVGGDYDRAELSVLAGSHGNQDNTQHVKSIDQLLMLLALDHEFTERFCRGEEMHTHTHTRTSTYRSIMVLIARMCVLTFSWSSEGVC